ncbi:MAG: flagellar hook-associated protein 2 [Planctomycetota bacterium]|jgi:flagellar hook-associated protein 2
MVGSSGISFSGLASGLDTAAIVSQLVALERIPINIARSHQGEQQSKLDKLNQFGELVKALQSKAEDLSTSSGFTKLAIKGQDGDIASISSGSTAIQGTHTVDILNLSSIDRWAFDGVGDDETDLGTVDGQTVDFEINGTSYSVSLNADGSNIEEIATAINSAAGDDVNASVVNTGTDASPSYQLVLAAKESGDDYRISNISTDLTNLSITYSAPDVNGDATSSSNLTVGLNASAEIDGLTITRSNNDFSDVLEGISVDAVGVGTTTFTVEPDKAAIRSEVDSFLKSYNDVVKFINTQNTFTASEEEGEAGASGELFGDSVLSSVKNAMSRGLFDVDIDIITADTQGYSTLSNVGITADNDGVLSIDDEIFDEKLLGDLDAFTDLFVDSDGFERDPDATPNTPEYYQDTTADSGLLATLARGLDQLFGNLPDDNPDIVVAGIFDLREDTFNRNIDRIGSDIRDKERRIEDFEENLVLRFARLEQLMAQLNSQGAALNATLGG